MWIILICAVMTSNGCTSMTAVNGTEQQCRAMLMGGTGKVSCVAPDGTVLVRNEEARRR